METSKILTKQEKEREKEGFDKRRPLQHLSGFQLRQSTIKKTSTNISPSLASNSSSSRIHLHRKDKISSGVTNNVPGKSSTLNVVAGSEENEEPRKSFSVISRKKGRPCLDKSRYGKSTTRLTCQPAQRSNLCSQRNPVKILKKGSEELAAKLKSSHVNVSAESSFKRFGLLFFSNLDSTEGCTPAGKLASTSFSDIMSFDDCKNVGENSVSKTSNGDSGTSVKTPPVEASVSPEIQCGSHSKMVALMSAAAPVCYGAGHLLSGVTDKRKCRRRGSLREGSGKVDLFYDEQNDVHVIDSSADSSIPLLAEASVRWLVSPCDQGADSENRPDRSKMSHGDGKNVGHYVIENNSAFSIGSLSSRNIIQTPSSGSSSYGCVGGSNVEAHHRNFVQFELDSIIKTLNAASVSPTSEMSIQDRPIMDSSSDSIIPVQLQKNVDHNRSWMSDSTSENLALSEMRISWRDEIVCRVDENDEFDCCPYLSDEEIVAVGCSDKQLMSYRPTKPREDEGNDLGIEYGKNEASSLEMDLDVLHSPILLKYEPSISSRGEGRASEDRVNACAESICTNGGDLAASCDSDWACLWENRVSQVKQSQTMGG